MSEVAVAVTSVSSTPKKVKGKSGSVSKKPRMKPSHPKTADMVNSAIKNLKDRGGSSLQAIKKYISANYKVDAEKLAPFIRKYLKGAVTTGSLVQTKGKGASGSFKLAGMGEKVVKKPQSGKPASKAKKTKPSAPKAIAAKKPSADAPKKAPVKPKVAKSPSKAKKTAKSPTKKPKAPKPKKVGATKSPKKTVPKKK